MSDLTVKQENFCLKYIETGNASEAYRLSYDAKKMKEATVNRTAKEMLDNPKIAARLKELRIPIIERHNITIESILKELEQARVIALTADDNGKAQPSAAVSASMGKAKLAGLLVDKSEITGANGGAIIIDSEARRARLAELQSKIEI